jgi:hypothetical protein
VLYGVAVRSFRRRIEKMADQPLSQHGDLKRPAIVARLERQELARRRRSTVIERFERRERARLQMRFYELSTMAALYAKERRVEIEDAYRELVKSLDSTGFLGARILYLHPDVSPPYFRKGPDLNPRGFNYPTHN